MLFILIVSSRRGQTILPTASIIDKVLQCDKHVLDYVSVSSITNLNRKSNFVESSEVRAYLLQTLPIVSVVHRPRE